MLSTSPRPSPQDDDLFSFESHMKTTLLDELARVDERVVGASDSRPSTAHSSPPQIPPTHPQ